MCRKLTHVEFEVKVKALEAKKRKRKILKDGVDVITSALVASPVAFVLYIIAEKVY